MALFSKDIETLDDLFVHQLRDIYYAEKQIVKALPKMIDKASDADLKQGFATISTRPGTTSTRVEQVFQMHGAKAKAVDCPAIDGIIKEANEVVGDVEDKEVLDAALIAAAQAVEHYEIDPLWHADRLGEAARSRRLRVRAAETLDEEKAADESSPKWPSCGSIGSGGLSGSHPQKTERDGHAPSLFRGNSPIVAKEIRCGHVRTNCPAFTGPRRLVPDDAICQVQPALAMFSTLRAAWAEPRRMAGPESSADVLAQESQRPLACQLGAVAVIDPAYHPG